MRYRATDVAGNVTVGTSTRGRRRHTAPTTAHHPGASVRLVHHAAVVHPGATDETGGSGVASIEYRIAGGEWTPYTIAVSVTGEGERLVEYRRPTRRATWGRSSRRPSRSTPSPPIVTSAESGTTTKTVTLTATDATSGVARIEYRIGDAATWSTYDGAAVVRRARHATSCATAPPTRRATPRGGQLEVMVSEPGEPVEPAKPSVSLTTAPAAANGRANWFTSPVTVTLTGAGGEGKLGLEYRIGGNGAWTAYTAPFRVTNDGVTLRPGPGDRRGRHGTSAISTLTVKMDATAPTVAVGGIADGAKLDVAAVRTARVSGSDATSGAAEQVVRLDGKVVSAPVRIDAMSLRTGTHELEVTVLDEAGNQASQTVTFRVVASYGGGKKLVKRLVDEDTRRSEARREAEEGAESAKRAERREDAGQALQVAQEVRAARVAGEGQRGEDRSQAPVADAEVPAVGAGTEHETSAERAARPAHHPRVRSPGPHAGSALRAPRWPGPRPGGGWCREAPPPAAGAGTRRSVPAPVRAASEPPRPPPDQPDQHAPAPPEPAERTTTP